MSWRWLFYPFEISENIIRSRRTFIFHINLFSNVLFASQQNSLPRLKTWKRFAWPEWEFENSRFRIVKIFGDWRTCLLFLWLLWVFIKKVDICLRKWFWKAAMTEELISMAWEPCFMKWCLDFPPSTSKTLIKCSKISCKKNYLSLLKSKSPLSWNNF